MVAIEVSNRWCLRREEFDQLQALGKVTKLNWWCKNMGKNQFVDYDRQIGSRVRGDQPFNQVLDLEPGEYMFGTGDYSVELNGRHCSQVFYLYVAEDGSGGVCKKYELPSNGGSGPSAPADGGYSPFGGSQSTFGTGNGGWAAPTPTAPPAPKEEYYIIPSYFVCMNDMSCNREEHSCDSADARDVMKDACCGNCIHALEVYVKKE